MLYNHDVEPQLVMHVDVGDLQCGGAEVCGVFLCFFVSLFSQKYSVLYRSPTFLGSACGLVTIEAMKEGGESVNITNTGVLPIPLWCVAFIIVFGMRRCVDVLCCCELRNGLLNDPCV